MAEKNIGPVGQVFLASLLLGLCLLGPLFGFSERTTELTSSETCQKCHAEIYRHWKNAMHSMSLEDPIFKSAYIESYFNTRGQAKYNCLRCHAPAVLVNGDYDLEQEITKEGVSCDFCHSVKAIHFEKRDHPFELEIGRIKRGPLSEASSPAHETKASPLFKSSELCAGCHEYVNDNGVSILGTYTEWKSGPYAKQGIPCQDCHMPLVSGNIVRPQVAASQQKKINLHAISASHSTEQLQKAVAVRIQNVHREEGVIQVTVEVSNTGSGHKVPTGIPSRKLVLLVELKAPNVYLTQHKTYERRLLDASGNPITKECEVFLLAASDVFDNRIPPKGTRRETFVFAEPEGREFTISARVDYLYRSTTLRPTEIRVKMAEDSKTLSK